MSEVKEAIPCLNMSGEYPLLLARVLNKGPRSIAAGLALQLSEKLIKPTTLEDWGFNSGLDVGRGNSGLGSDIGTVGVVSQLAAWKIPRYHPL